MIVINVNINKIENFNFKNRNNICRGITYFQILTKFKKIATNLKVIFFKYYLGKPLSFFGVGSSTIKVLVQSLTAHNVGPARVQTELAKLGRHRSSCLTAPLSPRLPQKPPLRPLPLGPLGRPFSPLL